MYESPVLEREQSQRTYQQNSNLQYTRENYNNTQYNQRQMYSRPVQNYTPNYVPNYSQQNDYYVQPQSDNINMNINSYDMSNMAQNSMNFAQAPTYNMPSYYAENIRYNNVSAQAQTHPTKYYFPTPVQANDYYRVQQPVKLENESEYEKVAPKPAKTKNKMTKMLIAVYFLIIAVCAALILINVVAAAGTSEVAAATTEVAQTYSSNSTYYSVNENGEVTAMEKTAQVVDYSYDTSTNWFDKLCDKIGKLIG